MPIDTVTWIQILINSGTLIAVIRLAFQMGAVTKTVEDNAKSIPKLYDITSSTNAKITEMAVTLRNTVTKGKEHEDDCDIDRKQLNKDVTVLQTQANLAGQ